MHGGRSTGPRTTKGIARLRAARTTHGGYSAETRAFNRHHLTVLRRGSVRMFAVIHRDGLPAELAARLSPMAPELRVPPEPTGGISRVEDRALLQAETAALAPWKQAMALARQARRADRAARAAPSGAKAAARARPLAPERSAGTAAPAAAALSAAPAAAQPKAHAPILSPAAQSRPQRTLAGVRAEPSSKPHATERAAPGVRGAPAAARVAGQPEAHAPIPPAPARPAPQPAPASTGAEALAKFRALERAAHALRSAPPPAQLAALPEAYAPIPPGAAQPTTQLVPAGARAKPAAEPHAPNRASHGVRSAVAPAGLAAQAKAHAPIPPTPAQPAPASARAEPVAKPHAPERAPEPGRVSRTIPVGRAARRWLRQQKRMHQNQPEGSRS